MSQRISHVPDLRMMDKDEQFNLLREPIGPEIRQLMATSPYTHSAVVDYLVGDGSPDVRAAVANRQDENTGARNHRLRKDRNSVVLQSIACNPLSAPYTLTELEHCGDTLTLLYLRENPGTPEDVVNRLYLSSPSY